MDAGQPDIAIEHIEASLRLSPRARIGGPLLAIGIAHLISRRFDEAVPKLLLAIQQNPTSPQAYRVLASCYAHMGRLEDAREIVGRLRAITPLVVPRAVPFRNPEHRELLLSGLRLAMGAETGQRHSASGLSLRLRRACVIPHPGVCRVPLTLSF